MSDTLEDINRRYQVPEGCDIQQVDPDRFFEIVPPKFLKGITRIGWRNFKKRGQQFVVRVGFFTCCCTGCTFGIDDVVKVEHYNEPKLANGKRPFSCVCTAAYKQGDRWVCAKNPSLFLLPTKKAWPFHHGSYSENVICYKEPVCLYKYEKYAAFLRAALSKGYNSDIYIRIFKFFLENKTVVCAKVTMDENCSFPTNVMSYSITTGSVKVRYWKK